MHQHPKLRVAFRVGGDFLKDDLMLSVAGAPGLAVGGAEGFTRSGHVPIWRPGIEDGAAAGGGEAGDAGAGGLDMGVATGLEVIMGAAEVLVTVITGGTATTLVVGMADVDAMVLD